MLPPAENHITCLSVIQKPLLPEALRCHTLEGHGSWSVLISPFLSSGTSLVTHGGLRACLTRPCGRDRLWNSLGCEEGERRNIRLSFELTRHSSRGWAAHLDTYPVCAITWSGSTGLGYRRVDDEHRARLATALSP